MGIELWYVVRFVNIEKARNFNIVFTHAGAALITIGLWIVGGEFIMKLLYPDTNWVTLFADTRYWRMMIGAMYYCMIVLVYYFVLYYNNFQQKTKKEVELNNLIKEAEIKMLRSQINPHFIFNSLNSISYLTMTEPEKAQEMIIKLSEFLRYSLGKTDQTQTSLGNEMKNIQLYLDIEKVRFGDRLRFESQIEKQCLEHLVPGMILQPLIENAIKYGVYESIDGATINIKCNHDQQFLKIVLTNSYENSSSKHKGEGIGIKNISERLKLLYGRGDLLYCTDKNNEFTATLYIPHN